MIENAQLIFTTADGPFVKTLPKIVEKCDLKGRTSRWLLTRCSEVKKSGAMTQACYSSGYGRISGPEK